MNTNNLWGPADTRYLWSSGVSLLCVVLSAGAMILTFYHCIVKGQSANYYVSGAANQIGRAVNSLVTKQQTYVKNHFGDVARAAEMYNNTLSKYFQNLIDKADRQERSADSIKKFLIWLTEFFMIFFLFIGLIIALTLVF